MNAAVVMTGITLVVALAASVALFVIEQSAAAWMTLFVGLIGVLLLVAMLASTVAAERK